MPKKKPTARQRDIERLAKDYQSSLASLDPEYQSVFGKKAEAVSGFEKQSQDFQKRLQDYQKSLAQYKKNPIQELKFGVGTAAGVDRSGPASAATVKIQPNKEYDWRSQTMYRVPELGNNYYTPYALEQLGWEVTADARGGLTSVFKRNPKPTFTEEAPPQAAEATQFDDELEQVKAKQKTLGEGFEREIAERKAGRVAATSRRAQARPMLSKGATL